MYRKYNKYKKSKKKQIQVSKYKHTTQLQIKILIDK